MNKKLPVFAAQVGDADETGILAISFVTAPAVERNFVALAKARAVKLNLDKQKQILTGVVLVPEQRIYRNEQPLGEYYITYSAADIEKIAAKMMRTGLALSNTTHQHTKVLQGNYLVECWTVADSKRDKAVALGLGELPVGTLLASYKIEDAKYWRDEVLTGNVKGFSLEGLFNFNTINMSKKPIAAKAAVKTPNKVSAFFKSVAAMLEGETETAAEALVEEAGKDETGSGEPFIIFELADGGEVHVDEDGFATLDGEQMPAGDHALADGNTIVIDDAGNLVITTEEPEGAEPTEAAVAMAKQRGLAMFKKTTKKSGSNEAKIASLKAQIAKLEATPSTGGKVVQPVKQAKDPSTMSFHERAAAAIKARQERTK